MSASPKRLIRAWRWLGLFPVVCCISCTSGEALNTVQGKVLHKDQPLKGALLTFHPEGATDITVELPVGYTKDDGTFTLTTGENEGAVAGKYVVTFICAEEAPAPAGGKNIGMVMGPPEPVDRFKGAYSDKSASKFQIEIKKGPNQLEPFKLK